MDTKKIGLRKCGSIEMKSVEEIIAAFRENRNKKEIPLKQIKKDIEQYGNRIVLYGAGSAGIAFLHYLRNVGIEPQYFADGDKEKWGKLCEDIEIINPASIISRVSQDALVIVTINTDGVHYCKDFKQALLADGHTGVHKKLKDLGCCNLIDYTYFRECYELFCGDKYNLPSCSDVNLMIEHEDEISQVYDLLYDNKSREVFTKILEFKLLDDSINIPTISDKRMYFEYDLFEKREDEVFLDCGACSGSSLKLFLESNQEVFERYYGIEPDNKNFVGLQEYIAGLSPDVGCKMQIMNKGVFSLDGKTNFFLLNGPGTFAAVEGADSIDTITIDTLLEGKKATYIKMNIEGSEVPALKGAEYTLKTYKPRLAVMGYHKTSDFWQVPLLIKKYNPNYKLYLRSYMQHIAFAYFAC